jgi:ATP-dependent Clp protease ATP-binding subunit ClpA
MFETFTDRGRKVMALANQEAQGFNHEYVGSEHILLGLVREDSGVAASIFKNRAIDSQKIRAETEKLIRAGPDMVTIGKLPLTPHAKRVIECAIEEARAFGHTYIGTEHLLLGILRDAGGAGAKVLQTLGLNLDSARKEIVSLVFPHVQELREAQAAPLSQPPQGDPETLRTRKVMQYALEEARASGSTAPRTEHLLLALLREPDGVAGRALANLGMTPEGLRAEIKRVLSGEEYPGATQAPG